MAALVTAMDMDTAGDTKRAGGVNVKMDGREKIVTWLKKLLVQTG